jgi:hypothetical protein
VSPFVVFIAICVEYIDGTASPDSQTFTGTGFLDCGLDGTFGPFAVSGHKCAEGGPCGGTPTPTASPTPTRTPTPPDCASDVPCATPDSGTRLAIRFRNGRSLIRWRWAQSSMASGFGDPIGTSDYQLCLETAGGSFSQTIPHGSGWRSTHSGFHYASSSGSVRTVRLRSSAEKTVVTTVVDTSAAPSLPLSMPVRMRLVQGSGPSTLCFESEFASPAVNDVQRFRANE